MRDRNRKCAEGEAIEVRIGVHQGDVVIERRDLLGDGVNVAARLEAIAAPGGVCISARFYDDATGKIDLDAEDMGEQQLKNITPGSGDGSTSPPSVSRFHNFEDDGDHAASRRLCCAFC
jgi:class 3 adenylate cyclase